MDTVKLSEKFQVVIPKGVRKDMNLKAGEKFVVIEKDGIINMIPVSRLKNMRGFVSGVTTENLRDESDRFD